MNKIVITPVPSPCKGCEDRYVGCHGQCLKYSDFRKAVDEHSKIAKGANDVYYDYRSEKRTKLLKWLKNKRSD